MGCVLPAPARLRRTVHRHQGGGRVLAATGWEAVIAALHGGQFPASGGERRMLLLAASIAAGTPVSLCDILTSIDQRNAGLVIAAITHATG